jgi:hypothetical protein
VKNEVLPSIFHYSVHYQKYLVNIVAEKKAYSFWIARKVDKNTNFFANYATK